jgi:aspartyl-tRNA(Asn)/glutamyl-tRNA(Gln) amidotransferase subunit A
VTTALLTILLADAASFHRHLLRERWADYDPATRLMFELGELTPGSHYVTAQRARTLIIQAMKNTFRAHGLDALLSPTLPITTVPIPELSEPGPSGEAAMTSLLRFTPVANLTGLPAISAPCGFASNGLPIGYQLIGRPFAEPTLFRLARAYEKQHSWELQKPELAAAPAMAGRV